MRVLSSAEGRVCPPGGPAASRDRRLCLPGLLPVASASSGAWGQACSGGSWMQPAGLPGRKEQREESRSWKPGPRSHLGGRPHVLKETQAISSRETVSETSAKCERSAGELWRPQSVETRSLEGGEDVDGAVQRRRQGSPGP